jgi:hypothetical protein
VELPMRFALDPSLKKVELPMRFALDPSLKKVELPMRFALVPLSQKTELPITLQFCAHDGDVNNPNSTAAIKYRMVSPPCRRSGI